MVQENELHKNNFLKSVAILIGLFILIFLFITNINSQNRPTLIGTIAILFFISIIIFILVTRDKFSSWFKVKKYLLTFILIYLSLSGILLGYTYYKSTYFTDTEQRGLSSASYIAYTALGKDSIHSYSDQKVFSNGVTGLLFVYNEPVSMDTVKNNLENIGFNAESISRENGSGWEYSSFEASKGNILAYITQYKKAFKDKYYILIAGGPVKYNNDIYSMQIASSESDEGVEKVYMKSNVKSTLGGSSNIEHVAPLAGTIYALTFPGHKLTGSPDASVNRQSSSMYTSTMNNSEYKTYSNHDRTFIWIWGSDRYNRDYRYSPTTVSRGAGYGIRGAGGPSVK